MLTNPEEYLANGLWLPLVTVLVTEPQSLTRTLAATLGQLSCPAPAIITPIHRRPGVSRDLSCVFLFFGPVSFYKALPDDSRGLAD